MAEIPNLAGVATQELVETIKGGGFAAAYINWSRTMQLLRVHAHGWLPELIPAPVGVLHQAPFGGFLLIRFKHADGTLTPEVPQAVMDTRNQSVPFDKITARDITDTHRRGVCMAAAFTFGLAYELWAKMPLESGFRKEDEKETVPPTYSEAAEKYEEDFKLLTENLDDNDYDRAYAIYHAIPDEYRNAVWVAPTKLPGDVVPVYTTKHRAQMKSSEWVAARNRYFKKEAA